MCECCCVNTGDDLDKHQTQLRGSDLDLAMSKAFATPVYKIYERWLYK